MGEAADLRALLDYREDLITERSELTNRVHADLLGLFPGYQEQITNLTGKAHLEAAAQLRPTDDLFKRELEEVGFEYVEVDVRPRTLRFPNGHELFEDPASRLMLLPEFRVNLHMPDDRPFTYVREAIDKYWSDGDFELTVNVGVVTGRRT